MRSDVIILTDPTMAGIRDPVKKIKKLQERIGHLKEQKNQIDDQIRLIQHDILKTKTKKFSLCLTPCPGDICSFTQCPDRRDDSYMEGEGEFYCEIHSGTPATYSCNFNLKDGCCPRGFRA